MVDSQIYVISKKTYFAWDLKLEEWLLLDCTAALYDDDACHAALLALQADSSCTELGSLIFGYFAQAHLRL